MATTPRSSARRGRDRAIEYPTSDGRPMAETDIHRQDMVDLIDMLRDHYEGDPDVYVSGNLLVFYEEGNPRRHVSPDVFVVRGVPKEPPRDHYLIWEEAKGLDLVIEITSKTTRSEDQKKKLALYRDVLKVPEYFQFDPTEDYLKPPMQGHRLVGGEYVPIEPVEGRLPSTVLGLHFERDGTQLRLVDPATGRRLPTRSEATEKARRNEAEARRNEAEARRGEAEARRDEEQARRNEAEAVRHASAVDQENERLRRELDELRRRQGGL
jgi:Uma2 family endonuclease